MYRDPRSDMPVTQFNMKWVEQAGLVKFDFLGLKTLTTLTTAVKLIAQRGIEIDLASRTVSVDGAAIKLTRKEFDVVALLARNAGKLVGHRQLLTTIWGPAHVADTHYLRIAIGHVREKIGDDAADPRFILTEPGVGYRLVDARNAAQA